MNVRTLRSKLRKRISGRDRQLRKFQKTGKAGHAKLAKVHVRAIRKLRRLITEAEKTKTISDQGIAFIAEFEGLPNGGRPYNDPIGYATVGYGHLIAYRPVLEADHGDIWVSNQQTPGKLTHEEALRLLKQDLARKYEPAVRVLFDVNGPLVNTFDQPTYDALVSFAYNLGTGSISGAYGFETMGRAIRSGKRKKIADAMTLYVYGGTQRLPGLVRRRNAEARLIRTGNYSTEFS
jgi:GH24 family phage-related lysozyme (muramidase)